MAANRNVLLKSVTREDVTRIGKWIADDAAANSRFGRYGYGDAAPRGATLDQLERATDEEFARSLEDPSHVTMSIYTDEGEHIGEIHIGLEDALGDGHLSIIMGRPRQWTRGYGAAGIRAALALAFDDCGLYRVWVDIPEGNLTARTLFERVGFAHEGTLRNNNRHSGESSGSSVVMGILAAEYSA